MLLNYGSHVLKRNLDLYQRGRFKDLRMVIQKHLQPILRMIEESFFGRFQKRNVGIRPAPSEGKKDMSKIQCFRWHKYGHYQDNRPKGNSNRKRRGKQHTSVVDFDHDHAHKKSRNVNSNAISPFFVSTKFTKKFCKFVR